MAVHQFSLPDELETFLRDQVRSGRYGNTTEVVSAALLSLKCAQSGRDERLDVLRTFIDEGDASGVADDGVFERIRHSVQSHVAA